MNLQVTSTAFQDRGMIPQRYTCDGKDVSPPLSWSDVPAEAQSIALVMNDPDAPVGTWVHWVVFNIPSNVQDLPEKVPTSSTLSNGAKQGMNSWRKSGYGGPCPPRGAHRYYFKVYALDVVLDLPSGITEAQLVTAMRGHILAEGHIMGRYARK